MFPSAKLRAGQASPARQWYHNLSNRAPGSRSETALFIQVARIKARYFFELPADDVDEPFEALLPEEEQIAKLIPELTHPDATMPLRRTILRFVHGDEETIAAALRPVIERWRRCGYGHSVGPAKG